MPAQSRITGAVALMGAQAVVLVLGYATHLWIGRVLGPAPYGIYGVVLSIQSIVGLLLTLGVPVAISRFVAQDPPTAKSILHQGLKIQAIVAAIVSLLTAIVSVPLSRLLGDSSLRNYILMTAVIIFAQGFYPLYVQFLSGLHRFNKQAALTAFYAVAKLLGALSLLYTFQVYGALAGFAIGGIAAGILGWWWTRTTTDTATPAALPVWSFLKFAGSYVVILVGLQILISLDLFMVKAILHDDEQAGYYNAAVTLSRISYQLLQALSFVLLPSVSALTRPGHDHDEAVAFIRDTLRYLIALIIPSVALAATTSRSLIQLFYSHQYNPAAPILTILMIGVGSIAFYLLLVNIVAGAGRAKIGVYTTFGLVLLSAILGKFLIPQFGLLGAAWQTTIAGLVGLLILTIYTFRVFGIKFPIWSTLNILIATGVAIVPTYFWQPAPLWLPLLYIVSGLFYVGTLLILREISSHDRRRVADIHPRLSWLAK